MKQNLKSLSSNMSKTSASVSSGVPNTEKQMKARGHRPSAFIVSRCLEPLMKHEARGFERTSQSRLKIQCNKACKNPRLKIQCNKACKNNVFPAGMVNTCSSCKSLSVFRKPFVPCQQCFIAFDGYGREEERKTESFSFAEKCI